MFEIKEKYGFDDFRQLISLLRSPEGCPWDREQTHESIRRNFIEETYEVCDAIDKNDWVLMREELGDVMLQIILHCDMEEQNGHFNVDDVIDEVCKKLVLRHPHVFTQLNIESSEDVLENWDKIKMKTKGQEKNSQSVADVPICLPALMRGKKILKRASKSGLVPDETQVHVSAIKNMADMLICGEKDKNEIILGEILINLTNLCRLFSIDGEECLTKSINTFINRFIAEEKKVESGIVIPDELSEDDRMDMLCPHRRSGI